MSGWILNVVGVIFLGVILDIILPEGKTNSFIKHIFSIFLLFVIISPINKLIKNEFKLNISENVINENFIYNTNINKIEELENLIKEKLDNRGLKNAFVIINANIFEKDLTINSVYVDTTHLNCKLNIETQEINNLILSEVVAHLNIEKEQVFIYGK